MSMENTAVIVLSGLTPEEKAKVLAEAREMCKKRGIEFIHNLSEEDDSADTYYWNHQSDLDI